MTIAAQDPDRSVAERIAQALSARIVNGALAPDAPLRQDHVAAEFGASHVPVREAFRKLEAQGLLVSAPRRGVRVAPLSPEEIRDVTEMRAALEALALRWAAPNLGPDDFTRAEAALGDGASSEDIQIWEQANRRFHAALTDPCAMPRLIAAIEDLRQTSARFLFAAWRDLAWRPRSDQEHAEVLAALRAGAVEAAAEGLAAHVRAAGRALIERLRRPAIPHLSR